MPEEGPSTWWRWGRNWYIYSPASLHSMFLMLSRRFAAGLSFTCPLLLGTLLTGFLSCLTSVPTYWASRASLQIDNLHHIFEKRQMRTLTMCTALRVEDSAQGKLRPASQSSKYASLVSLPLLPQRNLEDRPAL
jgi:hypothetical protein